MDQDDQHSARLSFKTEEAFSEEVKPLSDLHHYRVKGQR